MSRRIVLLLTLAVLAVLAVAVVPWTLSRDGLAASVAQQLRKGYGVTLDVRGRSTIAILPIPRVKFENVTLTAEDQGLTAKGGTLRGELRLLPLLLGRIELAEVGLSDSRVEIDLERLRSLDWAGAVASVRAEKLGSSPIRRLVITGSSVRWAAHRDGVLDDVGMVINWPDPKAQLDIAGWVVWRGEKIEIARAAVAPGPLTAGVATPFTLSLAVPSAKISAAGEAQLGPEPRVTGESKIEARSLRDFVRWSGVALPFGSLVRALTIEGDFSADRRRLTWPEVAVKLGSDAMDGSLTLRFEGTRPAITGTLAAETLDLSEIFAPFLQARTSSGLWSGEDISLSQAAGGDLDLRLSATAARIGRLRLADMAASVLVRPNRIEASLGRADLHEGTLKGRLTLTAQNKLTEVKTQATFENVDLGPALADFGHTRWITGLAQGQFVLEAAGRTVADMVRQSHGKATVTVKKGDLIGIGLESTLRRMEKQPLSASLEWKGGRTSFDRAVVNLNIGGGVGDITDGALSAPTMRTALEGRVSLVDRSLTIRAHVSPPTASTTPAPLIAFDVVGSWDDVSVIPDARAFIERSRAAKPLFGVDRLSPSARGASSVPQ